MQKTIEYFLDLPYTMELSYDPDHAWFIRVKELPGCTSQGETPDEAVAMVKDAMQLWIEDALEEGETVPEPRPEEEYSGKFNQRVPKSLHSKLVAAADKEGVSLNTFCATVLAEAVGIQSQPRSAPISPASAWEKAAEKLLSLCDVEARTGLSLEEGFSYWFQEELEEVRMEMETGDRISALGNLLAIEKLLRRAAKDSPLFTALAQPLLLLRQALQETPIAASSLESAYQVRTVVDEVNRSTITRKTERPDQIRSRQVGIMMTNSPADEFARLVNKFEQR